MFEGPDKYLLSRTGPLQRELLELGLTAHEETQFRLGDGRQCAMSVHDFSSHGLAPLSCQNDLELLGVGGYARPILQCELHGYVPWRCSRPKQ